MSVCSISHWVLSSTSGNWMPWWVASGLPNGARTLAYSTAWSMQYSAAPRLEAACRIRFSLKKCCTTCQAAALLAEDGAGGTPTSRRETRPWSVGMLKVHR